MDLKLSIVICTYQRPELLKLALESLGAQTLDAAQFEIIVVDNAGSDEVSQLVAAQDSGPRIRLVREEKLGLGYARNRGLAEANAQLVGFVDDDAKASPRWADLVVQAFERSPTPHCVGGPILPFYTSGKPAWFKDAYETWRWGDVARQLEPGEVFVGSNMTFRKSTLQDLGGFPTELGMRGEQMALGEDTLMFERLWARDPDAVCWYDPQLTVQHWVPPFKMRASYRLARHYGSGAAYGQIFRQRGLPAAISQLIWSIVVLPIHVLLALLFIVRFGVGKRWLVEAWEGAVRRCGVVAGLLGAKVSLRQAN